MAKGIHEVVDSHSFSCRGVDGNGAPAPKTSSKVTVIVNVYSDGANMVHCPRYTGACYCSQTSQPSIEGSGKCPYNASARKS